MNTMRGVKQAVARSAAERLTGNRPSRTRALFVAGVAAVGAGSATYKLLRSGDGRDEGGS